MQLCRFIHRETPEQVRAGVYHEGHFYETDGVNAIGVHEASQISLLPPFSVAPSVRVFQDSTQYCYVNSSGIVGALGEIDLPTDRTTFEVRVGAILKEGGRAIESSEASGFVMGLFVVVGFPIDIPMAMGPFITTPEEISPQLELKVKINDEYLETQKIELPNFGEMMAVASSSRELLPSDVLVGPAIQFPQTVQPGDTISAEIPSIGTLTIRLV